MDIIVLISGGVDSSVALQMLHRQGYRVTAFYLKIWLEDELAYLGSCPWEEDLSYVRAVCTQIGVPLEIVSLQKEYHERIVTHIIEQVAQGNTPNPDILCNSLIKFGLFVDLLEKQYQGIYNDYRIATGHYAQVVHDPHGIAHLYRSPDPIKDQSYFLALLNQKQLQRVMFPIGHLYKTEVRRLAEEYQLPNRLRKDSQGICFLGKFTFAQFIEYHLGKRSGAIREYETDQIIGAHQGYWFYTIGQRQGIGLSGGPWYVVKKDCTTNTIFVSRRYQEYTAELYARRTTFHVPTMHWLHERITNREQVSIKTRHGAQLHNAQITPEGTGYAIELAIPDQGIAPGQYAVIYREKECLGGGSMHE